MREEKKRHLDFYPRKIVLLTLLQTGQRSTTFTVTLPFGPLTVIDFPHRVFLFGLPWGVLGSKSGAAIAATSSLAPLLIPHAPRPANQHKES